LRGVSEYVATLIITLVTLAAGAAIFIYSYNVVDSYYNALIRTSEEVYGGSSAAILASYITSSRDLVIIASTGSKPVTVMAVYINESLATACTLFYNKTSASLSSSSAVTVPYYTAFVIRCGVSPSARYAYVKLVFEGGEVVAKASRVG